MPNSAKTTWSTKLAYTVLTTGQKVECYFTQDCFSPFLLRIFVMSDMQRILSDPSQSLQSTLSILLNAGDAGDTFQREIFQYLNIQDVRNIRMANSHLDQIVRGVRLWQTRDIVGNLFYSRNRPANATTLPTHNTTLRWLGGKCNGVLFPGQNPCQTGPLQVNRCTGVPPPLNPSPPHRFACRRDVCTVCVTNARNYFRPAEAGIVRQTRQVKLCRRCQLYEARRHTNGYSGCNCQTMLRGRWMCWSCQHETRVQIYAKANNKATLIRNLHRNRQGEKTSDPSRRPRSKPVCPGCARYFVDQNPQPGHVMYCTSCNDVVVQPTSGANYQPTTLIPNQPARQSPRLAAKYAAMPPLDL